LTRPEQPEIVLQFTLEFAANPLPVTGALRSPDRLGARTPA